MVHVLTRGSLQMCLCKSILFLKTSVFVYDIEILAEYVQIYRYFTFVLMT